MVRRLRLRSWRTWRLSGREAAEHVVGDCAAFLAGELAVVMARRGQMPQQWQWLNLLAHGSEAQIASLARDESPTEPRSLQEAKWYGALSFLASQIMDRCAAGCGTIADLQRDVLVPLELELATEAAAGRGEPPIPALLVRRVLARLTGTELHRR